MHEFIKKDIIVLIDSEDLFPELILIILTHESNSIFTALLAGRL